MESVLLLELCLSWTTGWATTIPRLALVKRWIDKWLQEWSSGMQKFSVVHNQNTPYFLAATSV
jgi:hypothetical protein